MRKKTDFFNSIFGESLFRGRGKRLRKVNPWQAGLWAEAISLENPISKRKTQDALAVSFSHWRLLPLYLLIIAIFAIIVGRLVMLQVIEGSIFLTQAQGNGVRIKTIHAPRGVIYDRNGIVLARNQPSFRVVWDLTRVKVEDREKIKKELTNLLGVKDEEIQTKIADFEKRLSEAALLEEKILIKQDVDLDTVLKLETREKELPGVLAEASPIREYPYGEVISHVLGYTGEISEKELQAEHFKDYQAGDLVGKDGVEKEFEAQLKGQDGQELVKVDSAGVRLGTVYSASPRSGNDLYLSIDINLQRRAFDALKKAVDDNQSPGGSVVVTDPNNGEILALVSYPSFDNNLFTKGISLADYQKLATDKRTPLLNRVLGASYPPGSTFKLVSAISGLETGKISAQTRYEDTGSVTLGPITFNNWYFTQYGRKEGPVDVIKALQRSNDTFFYLSSQQIGEKIIQDYAFKFGLGQTLGINLPGETTGLVPTDEWKRKVRGEPWYPGNTLNLSIGQGDLLSTPLQINSMTEVIANGGKLLKPSLLKDGKVEVIRGNFLKTDNIRLIKEGMVRVTTPGGTAWPFFTFPISSAGKTGTAESGDKKPHAWYTAFAPTNDPQLNVTVMLEKAGEGSSVASPVAKQIMAWYFYDRVNKQYKEGTASGEKIGD